METVMTKNGVTTLREKGSEQFEDIKLSGKNFVHYDYRHTNGVLFSVVKPTLEICRQERDKWIVNKLSGN